MGNQLLRIGLGLLLSVSLYAKGDSLSFLRPFDTLLIETNAFGEKIYQHKMEPGQTLYALAQFYGLHINELYFYNPHLRKGYGVGQSVKIPIPNRSILRYTHRDFERWHYIPVYYRVQRGETLYRISKLYFKMPVKEMMLRNGLVSHNLSPGQLLFVGWLSTGGISAEARKRSGPFAGSLRTMQLRFMASGANRKYREADGAAVWEKADKRTQLYALSRHVKPGSIIEVTNPWIRQTIYVKVVGGIPKSMYGDEAIIVLSGSAAELLGAIDRRFYVQIRY